ncbi:protein of unknown function [Candidatus Filomicrobium marinum]|uniref:Uncharacterized protein n=1 Tax=Candidatus Filomicrobium marinum TaxID=1608628 RepID=A0A0D6J9T9_9HYPH|nr:protein of unknown function [Candidatus Filomicrobium marinum]CPR15040.1 protein of unknown function [Candidatus Filomicrobium marinum]
MPAPQEKTNKGVPIRPTRNSEDFRPWRLGIGAQAEGNRRLQSRLRLSRLAAWRKAAGGLALALASPILAYTGKIRPRFTKHVAQSTRPS